MSNKNLGRGIASLLEMDDNISFDDFENDGEGGDNDYGSKEGLRKLDIEDIIPNPEQPRKVFDDAKLHELAESIKNSGLIQPIVVAPYPEEYGKYVIISGERRYRATKLAGLQTINAIVMDIDEQEQFRNALIENIQRVDLNPVEEARAYDTMMDMYGYTQEQIAKEVGKSRAHIANLVRILKLPEDIISAIKNGNISLGHAKVLLGTENPQEYLEEIIANQLSVRDLEDLIEERTNPKSGDENTDDKENLEEIPNKIKKGKGSKNNSGKNEKTKSASPIDLAMSAIQQMYSPDVLHEADEDNSTQSYGDNGAQNDEAEQHRVDAINENLRIIEEHIKKLTGFDVILNLFPDGNGNVVLKYNDTDGLLKILTCIQNGADENEENE